MLLSELLKRTPTDHPDHPQLESALSEVVKLADDINESVRAAESDEHVRQLQRKLVGLDFSVARARSSLCSRWCIGQSVRFFVLLNFIFTFRFGIGVFLRI